MGRFKPISFEDFNRGLSIINARVNGHEKFLYSVYSYTVEGIGDLAEGNLFENLQGINHLEIIGYCVGEYSYLIAGANEEQIKKMQQDENFTVSNFISHFRNQHNKNNTSAHAKRQAGGESFSGSPPTCGRLTHPSDGRGDKLSF